MPSLHDIHDACRLFGPASLLIHLPKILRHEVGDCDCLERRAGCRDRLKPLILIKVKSPKRCRELSPSVDDVARRSARYCAVVSILQPVRKEHPVIALHAVDKQSTLEEPVVFVSCTAVFELHFVAPKRASAKVEAKSVATRLDESLLARPVQPELVLLLVVARSGAVHLGPLLGGEHVVEVFRKLLEALGISSHLPDLLRRGAVNADHTRAPLRGEHDEVPLVARVEVEVVERPVAGNVAVHVRTERFFPLRSSDDDIGEFYAQAYVGRSFCQ